MHPLVAAQVPLFEKYAAMARAAGAKAPTEPEASAVVAVFLLKVCGDPTAAEVPLEELVDPGALPTWQMILDDPAKGAALRDALKHLGLSHRVRPQADGSLGVLLAWQHPDQAEPELHMQPRLVESRTALVVNVPGIGWRLRDIV
jgi:hypothetical protein